MSIRYLCVVFFIVVTAVAAGEAQTPVNTSIDYPASYWGQPFKPIDPPRTGKWLQDELDAWDPSQEPTAGLPQCLLAEGLDVTGRWTAHNVPDGPWIEISGTESGSYEVVFDAGDYWAWWRLRRSATFIDGVLQLDGPVRAPSPRKQLFSKLYAASHEGTSFLIPSTYVFWIDELLDQGGCPTVRASDLLCCSFRRARPDEQSPVDDPPR